MNVRRLRAARRRARPAPAPRRRSRGPRPLHPSKKIPLHRKPPLRPRRPARRAEGTGVRPERNSSIRDEPRQLREPQEEHLERERRDVGPSERAVGLRQERQETQERRVGRRRARTRRGAPRPPRRARAAERARVGGEAHGAAHERRQVVQRRARVRARRLQLRAALEDAGAVARQDRREERDERGPVGRPEERGDVRRRHAAARARHGLVEEREPVAEAAGRRGGQRAERRPLDERRRLLRGGCGPDDREPLARARRPRAGRRPPRPSGAGSRTAGSARGSSPGSCGARSSRG